MSAVGISIFTPVAGTPQFQLSAVFQSELTDPFQILEEITVIVTAAVVADEQLPLLTTALK